MENEWMLPSSLNLRLAGNDDGEFLLSLFCSARPELALLPLPPEQLTLMGRQQYEFQQQGYANYYPHAEDWIITADSKAVGKIMFDRSTPTVHIIDFIIAPDWRGRGVGSAILAALKAYVEARADVLSLRVDHRNSHAKRLYQRLGFVMKQSANDHEFMVWLPIKQLR
ncbi:MAG: family N-acetyltransferase [Cellvibrio sp.]|jgi:ribosomal protein S18 acetylase RimI-like enzyme|nr:family N-acetyltransferase [Cellvibrio sp.]